MPDATATPKAPNRALVLLTLLAQCVGTAGLIGLSFWRFFEENRGDGLWYLSLGILWFMFFGWRLRWLTHPKPAQ